MSAREYMALLEVEIVNLHEDFEERLFSISVI